MKELLKNFVWRRPRSYAGHSPDGDYSIYSQTRDSDAMVRSNFRAILRELQDVSKGLPKPLVTGEEDFSENWVYSFRCRHFAHGWTENIIVKKDSPEPVLEAAGKVLKALLDFPVYCEKSYALEREEYQQDEADWDFIYKKNE